jgi:hypothetical protein
LGCRRCLRYAAGRVPLSFNTAGPCIPGEHCMLPPERRFGRVLELVDEGKYFTVRAGRQATRDAGEIAGLTVERLVNEPTVAGLNVRSMHTERGPARVPKTHRARSAAASGPVVSTPS